jgi:hypothetical protein
MEVGDLVQQRGSGVSVISDFIKQNLNLGLVGVIIEVKEGSNHAYDGRPRDTLVIHWSNGKIERLPEIYLEKVEKTLDK